jgi:hypothetical protein
MRETVGDAVFDERLVFGFSRFRVRPTEVNACRGSNKALE